MASAHGANHRALARGPANALAFDLGRHVADALSMLFERRIPEDRQRSSAPSLPCAKSLIFNL